MNPICLSLNLNLRLRLDDSIPIITPIFGKQLIHVRAAFTRVIIHIIKVILHPEQVLLLVPHECMVETELRHLGLSSCQDDFMQHWGFSLKDHLHRAFIVDLLKCNSMGRRRWWCSSRGCSGILSVIGILLFLFILVIFSHAVQSSLPSDLHK
jgi:hypothetical protein